MRACTPSTRNWCRISRWLIPASALGARVRAATAVPCLPFDALGALIALSYRLLCDGRLRRCGSLIGARCSLCRRSCFLCPFIPHRAVVLIVCWDLQEAAMSATLLSSDAWPRSLELPHVKVTHCASLVACPCAPVSNGSAVSALRCRCIASSSVCLQLLAIRVSCSSN